MYKEKLPNDQLALVFGIVSLVLLLLGCCCGLFALVSLGLGIAAVAIATKGLRLFRMNPEGYVESSKSNLDAAKIMGIIGIVLSAIVLLIQIAYFAIVGTMATTEGWKRILEDRYEDRRTERNFEESDSIAPKMESDSISVDSVYIE